MIESPTISHSYIWGKGLCSNLCLQERYIRKYQEKNEEKRKEVRRVLFAKRESLISFPTNMLLHFSSSVTGLPTGCIPKDIPYELLPLRSIKYHKDLTLGDTLPNNAAYRMNPKEANEF
ncbi:hypothetical protein CR513_11555, partial [Mucuna pruriens]